jgi:hypothetical protein
VQDIDSPRAFVETSTGLALVLDGRAQEVFAIDAGRSTTRRVIRVGTELGHILRPTGFALGPNDVLAIVDSPGAYSRVQYFGADGRVISHFYLASWPGARMALGGLALQGAGPMAFTGRTFLFNAPATGGLISEFDNGGNAVRSIGTLRSTGYDSGSAIHTALNSGLPLVDPTGGFYFVFDTGLPVFRKYDAAGVLQFERHIEGVEIDAAVQSMPTHWAAPAPDADSHPFTPGVIETAAVDPSGRLWVSLTAGYTYVYDRGGDKIRTIQFQAPRVVMPISFFFAARHRLLVTPGCYEFDSQ